VIAVQILTTLPQVAPPMPKAETSQFAISTSNISHPGNTSSQHQHIIDGKSLHLHLS
jgi:hypothetical protein